MKKTSYGIFLGAFLVLCLIPFVCMIFAKSDETIGNEMAVSAPSFQTEENKFNFEILEDTGTWFEHHFAFRPQLITADARIQKSLFGVSNTETVVTGTDGWLYYSSTRNDFLGREQLSERGMFNLAHNVSLLQKYAESNGAKFLFMVAPNKNTLYGEHMPYYEVKTEGAVRNRDRLKTALEEADVHYLDLFALFEEQEETLYLKQDSHWNNKGALMVYNEALSAIGKDHETYADTEVTEENVHAGDLSAMIFPASEEKETDFVYHYEPKFVYLGDDNKPSDTVTVEDGHIRSMKGSAKDALLMYRDSFGNTLIPFIAEAYQSAYYSKGVPYNLALDMEQQHPNHVICEKVERNVSDFAKEPGIIPAPAAMRSQLDLKALDGAEVKVDPCEANASYVRFSGEAPDGLLEDSNARFYLGIKDASGAEMLYEMFTVCTENTDYGYLAFLPMARFGSIESIDRNGLSVYTVSAEK